MSNGYRPLESVPTEPPTGKTRLVSSVVSAIDPGDPAHALLVAVEAMQKQSQRELGALVTKLAGDIAASAVLAEQAARAKAEIVVTQAGIWAGEQIRQAGQDIVQDLHAGLDPLRKPGGRAPFALWHGMLVGAPIGLAGWWLIWLAVRYLTQS